MIHLFDEVAYECSQKVTNGYSTSFSSAVRMLAPSIRPAIHSIYGFVRFADEVVDTFHFASLAEVQRNEHVFI